MIWESCWTTNSTDPRRTRRKRVGGGYHSSTGRWVQRALRCVLKFGSDRRLPLSLYIGGDYVVQRSTGSGLYRADRSAFLRGDSPPLGALRQRYTQWRIPIFSSHHHHPERTEVWTRVTTNKRRRRRKKEEVVLQILEGELGCPLWLFRGVTKWLKFCAVRVNASLTEQFKRQWKCSATVERKWQFKRPQSALQRECLSFVLAEEAKSNQDVITTLTSTKEKVKEAVDTE